MNETDFETWGGIIVAASTLRQEQQRNRYGTLADLPEEKLADPDELKRLAYRQMWWPSIPSRNADDIPIMTEGWWVDAWPRHTDVPSTYRDHFQAGGSGEMRTICVDRHKLTQNVLFASYGVRRTSLKQLWRLRWHRQYDTQAVLPEWPD